MEVEGQYPISVPNNLNIKIEIIAPKQVRITESNGNQIVVTKGEETEAKEVWADYMPLTKTIYGVPQEIDFTGYALWSMGIGRVWGYWRYGVRETQSCLRQHLKRRFGSTGS